MESVVILVDFDNFFGTDIEKVSAVLLEYQLSQLLKICEREITTFKTVSIRFYGGWYKDASLTKQASVLQQRLRDVNLFPKVTTTRVISGSLETSSSLYSKPDFIWAHTYKEKSGVSRIRIDHENVDDLCSEHRKTCPKFIIYNFTKSRDKICAVDGCANLQKNVFKGAEQKMVDTLIACDIVSIVEDTNVSGILIASDDLDHFPALALASIKKSDSIDSIILVLRNEKRLEFVTELISQFGIKIFTV